MDLLNTSLIPLVVWCLLYLTAEDDADNAEDDDDDDD